MVHRPKFTPSRLRELGSSRGDPISLGGMEDRPDDEYDSYLLQAAGRLWNGASEEEVTTTSSASNPNTWDLAMCPVFARGAGEVVKALSD